MTDNLSEIDEKGVGNIINLLATNDGISNFKALEFIFKQISIGRDVSIYVSSVYFTQLFEKRRHASDLTSSGTLMIYRILLNSSFDLCLWSPMLSHCVYDVVNASNILVKCSAFQFLSKFPKGILLFSQFYLTYLS